MKKTGKSLAAACLAVVLAVSALTACGNKNAAESTPAAGAEANEGGEKVLKVAMECSYAPYNWTQPTDANGAVAISGGSDFAYGYDVMMAKKIADTLGLKLEIVKLDWDSLVPAVLVKTGGKYENAASVADLAGATATSQLNTIWYDNCLPQIPDGNIQPAQESAPAMLVALNSGRCDLVVTDKPTGQAALIAYPDFKLLDFTGKDGEFQVSDEDINIGISLKKGNTELKDAINSVLATMTKDDYNKMMEEAISVQPLSE